MKKSLLTLVPTPLASDLPLEPKAYELLQQAVTDEDALFVHEEPSLAPKRWLSFGLPRSSIEHFHYLNEHNKKVKTRELLDLLKEGKQLYLLSDCGLPVLSDPGVELVDLCHKNKIQVTSTPFPNSFLLALALSGFNARRFHFEGFLPREEKERNFRLQWLQRNPMTLILMEAPYRLQKVLSEAKTFFQGRTLCMAIDLNMPSERVIRGSYERVMKELGSTKKAEFVLIVNQMDRDHR